MHKQDSGFINNVLKLMTGNIVAQGLAILSMPIITRFFTPEMYGVAALFVSITTILGLFSCLRYEYAIMLPSKDEEAINVLAVSLLSNIGVTFITTVIIYLMGDYFIKIFHIQAISDYLWLIPITVMFLGFNSTLIYWNSRKKRFGQQATIQIVSSIIIQSIKLYAGLVGLASSGILIVGGLLGSMSTSMLYGLNMMRSDYALFINQINLSNITMAFKKYKKFPLVDLWGGFFNAASWQLPTLMLAFFFSPKIIGFWALGYTVVRMPMTLIGQSVGNVFYQKVSEDKNTGQHVKTVDEVFKFLIAYGLPPMILLSIIGTDLFIVVFGDNWAEAGLYTQILAPWLFVNFVASATSTIFYIFGKFKMSFYIHALIFFSRFISLYIGGIMGDVYLALLLYSISGVLIYSYTSFLSLRFANIDPVQILKFFVKHIIYFLPFAILIYMLKLNFGLITYLMVSGLITFLYLVFFITPNNPIGKTLLKMRRKS